MTRWPQKLVVRLYHWHGVRWANQSKEHMNYQRRAMRPFLPVLLLTGLFGCTGMNSSFHQTDPSFQPAPVFAGGGSPAVYLNEKEVPRVPIRSVGIITVAAWPGISAEELRQKAAAKGKELGCWAVIEHSAFLMLQVHPSAWMGESEAKVILVHDGGHGGGGGSGSGGGGGHGGGSGSRGDRRFDCVVRDEVKA